MINKNSKHFLAQVTSNYFCAGMVIKEGTIIRAAPILRKYATGKRFIEFIKYANSRGWRVNVIK